MMMTLEQRVAQLEAQMGALQARVTYLEGRSMPIGPSAPYGPVTHPYQPPPAVSPYPNPMSPWNPPYTITCKMADGTTKEMTFTTPIVAQTNE